MYQDRIQVVTSAPKLPADTAIHTWHTDTQAGFSVNVMLPKDARSSKAVAKWSTKLFDSLEATFSEDGPSNGDSNAAVVGELVEPMKQLLEKIGLPKDAFENLQYHLRLGLRELCSDLVFYATLGLTRPERTLLYRLGSKLRYSSGTALRQTYGDVFASSLEDEAERTLQFDGGMDDDAKYEAIKTEASRILANKDSGDMFKELLDLRRNIDAKLERSGQSNFKMVLDIEAGTVGFEVRDYYPCPGYESKHWNPTEACLTAAGLHRHNGRGILLVKHEGGCNLSLEVIDDYRRNFKKNLALYRPKGSATSASA